MVLENTYSEDIIMDLNIPFKVYFFLFLVIILIIAFKYFFSKEEIFDFIEKSRKNALNQPDKNDKLVILTQLNTKINRDYLDNSQYYSELGYLKLFGCQKEKIVINNSEKRKKRNNKKVGFSNSILYENCENENENVKIL